MSTTAFSGFKGSRALLEAVKVTSRSSTSTTSGAAKASSKQSTGTTIAHSKKKAATSATTASSKSMASAAKQGKKPSSTSRVSGLLKLYPVSPALRSFLGVSETCRPHAVKEVWAYAKRHNLQNHENRREIFCDEKLKTIFGGKDKVGFSDIGKLLSQHIVKTA